MAWSFKPIQCRLMQDVRVLSLDAHDRSVLLSLYVGSDAHGRFVNHQVALAVSLGMVGPGWSPCAAVDRLAAVGLLHLYKADDGQQYGQIDRWDDDLTADHMNKRPKSLHPSPPPELWSAAQCVGKYRNGRHEPARRECTDAVQTLSGRGTDAVQTPYFEPTPKEGRKERRKGAEQLARLADLKDNNAAVEAKRERLRKQAKGGRDG